MANLWRSQTLHSLSVGIKNCVSTWKQHSHSLESKNTKSSWAAAIPHPGMHECKQNKIIHLYRRSLYIQACEYLQLHHWLWARGKNNPYVDESRCGISLWSGIVFVYEKELSTEPNHSMNEIWKDYIKLIKEDIKNYMLTIQFLWNYKSGKIYKRQKLDLHFLGLEGKVE